MNNIKEIWNSRARPTGLSLVILFCIQTCKEIGKAMDNNDIKHLSQHTEIWATFVDISEQNLQAMKDYALKHKLKLVYKHDSSFHGTSKYYFIGCNEIIDQGFYTTRTVIADWCK